MDQTEVVATRSASHRRECPSWPVFPPPAPCGRWPAHLTLRRRTPGRRLTPARVRDATPSRAAGHRLTPRGTSPLSPCQSAISRELIADYGRPHGLAQRTPRRKTLRHGSRRWGRGKLPSKPMVRRRSIASARGSCCAHSGAAERPGRNCCSSWRTHCSGAVGCSRSERGAAADFRIGTQWPVL